MPNNKQSSKKNKQPNNKDKSMPFNSDQLGENASEEFKSEEYSNSWQSVKKQ